ncbi:MAG: aminotransferase class V-fold PLP-dependent enzyme, partial [Stackebrandtia sp.]
GATAAVSDDAVAEAEWKTGPARHEAGSPNTVGAVALAAVCQALSDEAWPELVAREESLRSRLSTGLSEIPGVRRLHLFGADSPRVGTVTFTVDGLPSGLAAAALSAEHGIGVRDGLFCAHPLTRRLVKESGTLCGDGSALRASIGLGSSIDDVDRLIEATARLSSTGPKWTYATVDSRVAPTPDPRA